MLAKAVDLGIDWAEFLPLALFAIRQVPNRDLGYSPHYLVYGRDVHGPLDVLLSLMIGFLLFMILQSMRRVRMWRNVCCPLTKESLIDLWK